VSGKVLEDGELTLEVEGIPLAPKSSIASLRIENPNDGIFDKVVDKKSNTNDIKELQKVLTALGFYKEETDGKWNKKIVDAIFDYQMSEKLISGIGDFGA
jgi:peptidoglycan hydrolase-like protein with peptidoglycan-binding domain